MEAAAGRKLAGKDRARLAVLAFYHDAGKVNLGFWARQFDDDRYRLGRRHGHIRELAGLFGDSRLQSQAIEALGLTALDPGAGVLERYLFGVFAHHGTPVTRARGRARPAGQVTEAVEGRRCIRPDGRARAARRGGAAA
jgi:CRISPR-associated endonuclease/helicase Cas3